MPNSKVIKDENSDPKITLKTTRFLPLELSLGIEINIYNNKVTFMSFEDRKYVGVIIENEEIYKAMVNIHKACWMFTEYLDL